MPEPSFLELAEVLYIHADQIERYGGIASIRDAGLLESALAMPRAGFGGAWLHHDLFEMAAAYLFHIVQNHRLLTAISAPERRPRWCSWS
ncbi:hypothetical protein RAS1_29520 [Phycisphaerae bacterium RAS1]|nr:hypothetical protein RAS1_29520 [Phycisphaerae bacterium RAS1]